MRPIPRLRFKIVALLAIAIAVNYLDRQNFPVVISEVEKEIPLSNQQYSQLQSLFLFAYAISYAVGGRIIDGLGARIGYSLMIVVWSWANGMHGLATSVWTLAVFRVLLGLGEGGAYPGAAKAVSEWFPPVERSWAFGIFNSGSSIGSMIAPTTLAAAELAERVCYGMELDPKYVDVIVMRWQSLTNQKAMLDGDGRNFDEVAEERRKEAA